MADPFIEAVTERVGGLRIGAGTEPDSQLGPLITGAHRDKVASYLDIAIAEGAKVLIDGRQQSFDGDGFFLGASLLDSVHTDMAVYRDEIFGPVLAIVRVDTADEALRIVNANPYGNGAAVFTRDGGAARSFELDVEAGMVGINVPIPVPVAYYSFGGWKDSLFGDSHMYGAEGVHFYTRTKVVTSRWPNPSTSAVDLGFPMSS